MDRWTVSEACYRLSQRVETTSADSDNILRLKMNRTGQIISTALVRISCVIGVIACLCFSAGEGLRLTPLPVLPLAEINSSSFLVNVISATLTRGPSKFLGGPLDRPAQVQVQKRSKRPLLDYEYQPTSGTSEIPFYPLQYLGANDRCDHVSHFPEAQPPSRAPPLFS